MKHNRLVWPIAGIIALLATLLFISGFVYAVREILVPSPSGPQTVPQTEGRPNDPLSKDKIQILALGDSLTKGVGDEAGDGYVGKVKRTLEQETGRPVYVWNYAVNGARTKDLLAKLEEAGSADYVRQANVILLTIGGNDLNQFASVPGGNAGVGTNQAAPAQLPAAAPSAGNGAVPGTEGLAIPYEEIRKGMPAVLTRLDTIIGKLAQMNPNAKIVYVGLYHPYLDYDPERKGSVLIQEWNFGAFQIANQYPNVTVVPTFDVFQNHLSEMLFGDHFHPNGKGYETMAERVMQVLR